ncbi:MAG: hypothetical protein KKF46_03425 [Nanoarchaeota archaeon]|nr:hypothetical protein [Nanoarchaeota archaeon]MBU1321385.1 hypothetical protein [Nanoarchaeota archaeon]MBU1597445.1 hypothetical protein [Nanoarchaeota archaeon]MBU2441349.1 hypothetical protein [Nanoarchaeota archaeon]
MSALALLCLLTVLVWADADDPQAIESITEGVSTRFNASSIAVPNISTVTAGNVSQINFTALSVTKAWAGYYGEITGRIVLENIERYVFYNWTSTEPKGEIYAATDNSITWASIKCFNETDTGAINLSSQEAKYGIDSIDVDGIDETFNLTDHIAFQVGTNPIGVDSCPSTYVYGAAGYQTTHFSNVLLTDAATLVFTTIIENDEIDNNTDVVGFDGVTHDFQLLLAEDGHDGGPEDVTTTYYFWAEIE